MEEYREMEKYREYVDCYITLMKMADEVKCPFLADEKLLKSLEMILKYLAVQYEFVLDNKDGCQIPKGDWWFYNNYKWVGNYRVEIWKAKNASFYADLMRIERRHKKYDLS